MESLHKSHLIVRLSTFQRKCSEYSFPLKIDASNVEVINIHQIKECLLLSCVASFEDWSNIFRT